MIIMRSVFRLSITDLCKGLDERTKMIKTCAQSVANLSCSASHE